MLNKSGKDDSDLLAKLQSEYHQFRQDNLHADTQIRNLTSEWREASEQLQTCEEVLAETRQLLKKEQDLTAKLRKRHLELQGENRDVA